MNIIKPKKLQIGDKIGIVAPAGSVDGKEKALKAKLFFENLGYKIVFGKNIFKNNGYLAGTDEEKLEDLHNFFADKSISAIFCLRGGYGSIRLINKIDYDLIKNNPKIFAGYSDITALCTMFLTKANLITYHAPMFQSDFGVDKISDFTLKHFIHTIANNDITALNAKNVYNSGKTQGILFGGNLTTMGSLCGVDFVPKEKFIFFAEDLNEPVYKIDRMFTQLLNVKEFRTNIQGILLGDFLSVDDKKLLDNFFKELAEKFNIPILSGFKITHKKHKLTIPIGTKAEINNGTVIF